MVSVISFNSFQLDLVNAQLRQGAQPISITPKSFAVLHYLLQHPGRLVTKEDLLAAVWPKSYVGDAVLKVCIREIRKALGDDMRNRPLGTVSLRLAQLNRHSIDYWPALICHCFATPV